MSEVRRRILEQHVVGRGIGHKLVVTIRPLDGNLDRNTQFTIHIEGEGMSGLLASQRKGARVFSATSAMRFCREKLGHSTATVHLFSASEKEGIGTKQFKGGK